MTKDEVLELVLAEARLRLEVYVLADKDRDKPEVRRELRERFNEHRQALARLQSAGEEYYRESVAS